jgi:exonuclease SbcD
MIRILHFADLHLGVENYSHIDPATGLSTCFGDFLATLDEVVEFAQDADIDLVLFCGDAYRSRDPTQTQQREFAKRIRRLAASDIPTFLLVGNHDLPNAVGRATAVEIFDTLAIENVIVASRPATYRIKTKRGIAQIVALPWMRRNVLLSQEETKNLTLEQLNRRLEKILTGFLVAEIKKTTPNLPTILAAHVSFSNATPGSEKIMMLGSEPILPQSSIANSALNYVALGHIHKSQILSYNPPTVYSGSLQRIDFSDEEDTKGFFVVQIDKEETYFDFYPVKARRFLTIKVHIPPQESNPTSTILRAIAQREREVKDAIVRVHITIPERVVGLVQEPEIRKVLKEAQYITVAKEVEREHCIRLPSWPTKEMPPLDALNAYLRSKKTSPDRTKVLLEYGEKLIQQDVASTEN